MTDRHFGTEGTARAALAFALAACAADPALAQQGETPTPAPSPARPLDGFRLPPADDGRAPGVEGPSNNGLPPLAPGERRGAPTPTPTPPRTTVLPPPVIPTRPATATGASPQPSPAPPRRETPANSAARTAPDVLSAGPSAPTPDSQALAAPPATGLAPKGETLPPPVADSAAVPPPAGDREKTPVWAWLLAALAALGAGLWYWRRRPVLAAPASGERSDPPPPEAPAAARASAPPTRQAAPASRPAPAPAAPALPTLTPAQRASPLVNRPAPERRALVSMALDIQAIRFTPEHVAVAFALNLVNQGATAATGMMVRIALQQGSAMPEAVLARFFDGAGGSVLRDDLDLAVGAGEALTTEVLLPRAAIAPLMMGGKPMLVPVMAFDVTYHWDGEGDAFGQVAGSFVLGREAANGGGDKLAPLSLERADYGVDRPGARATAIRRSQ